MSRGVNSKIVNNNLGCFWRWRLLHKQRWAKAERRVFVAAPNSKLQTASRPKVADSGAAGSCLGAQP